MSNGIWRSQQGGIQKYTWATKPAIASLPSYTPILITDVGVGGSLWHHDGTDWHPTATEVVLAAKGGTVATPLASLSGIAVDTKFTLPADILIPGGMIIPETAHLIVDALFQRLGTGGANLWKMHVGTANTIGDAATSHASTAVNAQGLRARHAFVFPTTSAVMTDRQAFNTNAGFVGADLSTNIDTDADMYVNFSVGSANAADTYQLFSYSVILRQ
jgi:hypothetical protein